MILLLVESGANVNAVSKAGETPFQRAVNDDIASLQANYRCDVHTQKGVNRQHPLRFKEHWRL